MKPTTWRAGLLTLWAIAVFLTVANVADVTGIGGAPPWFGLWGAVWGVSDAPYNLEVQVIDPHGPAKRAGLRVGDLIDIRANSLIERFEEFFQPLNGKPVPLSIRREALQSRITVVPGPTLHLTQRWISIFGALGNCWLLLFAALIAWRRAFVPGNLLLSFVLVLVASSVSSNFVTPWTWGYLISFICLQTGVMSVAVWVAFAGCFARPLSRVRLMAQWLCYAFVATGVAIIVAQFVGLITLRFDPVGLFYAPGWQIPNAAAILTALVCSALAIAARDGVDRQRAAWSLVPLAVLYCLGQLQTLVNLVPSSYPTLIAFGLANAAVFAIVPVVLTYAAVSRRLIDIGFVLNRTVVFAIVSAIVIGAFILVEWGASAWLSNLTHTTSIAIGMVLALGLGLSMRYIHKYVDHFVDRVFFRKRHEDEAALRRFAHESSYITDHKILLERAVREVQEHTNAEDTAIFVVDGAGQYVSTSLGKCLTVSENDPGIVSLRAWNKSVDLHDIQGSQLRGEFAFPMISRGALVGVLVCGPKRDGESYAPDESDALFTFAHNVGAALDTFSARSNGAIVSLLEVQRETMARILDQQDALMRQVRQALPPTDR